MKPFTFKIKGAVSNTRHIHNYAYHYFFPVSSIITSRINNAFPLILQSLKISVVYIHLNFSNILHLFIKLFIKNIYKTITY